MDKQDKKIAFIGVGHMGSAMITGFIAADTSFAKKIIATSHSIEKLQKLKKQFGIEIYSNNKKAALEADVIVICVKPFSVKEVLEEIKEEIEGKILISVAAGISIQNLQKNSGDSKQKIIRVMPNIPVSVNTGVIAFLANNNISENEKYGLQKMFSLLGKVFEVTSDKELNYFSLIPGCGPALVSYCIEMFSKSGKAFGLSEELWDSVALQTFIGTLKYMKKTKQTPQELQNAVATKGGVTERIIQTLVKEKFEKIFSKSIFEGSKKIQEIEKALS